MQKGLANRTWADFRSHWREALGFHVLIQLLGLAIFTPMTTWIGRRLVQASGEPVISNFDIASFVLSPISATGILLIVALVSPPWRSLPLDCAVAWTQMAQAASSKQHAINSGDDSSGNVGAPGFWLCPA